MIAPAGLERIAAQTARAAAAHVAGEYGAARSVAAKSSPTDVVTQTDRDSELGIRRALLDATPDAGILGEEAGSSAPEAALQWIVDPLDGTVNFLYGVPLFAVSIAAALGGEVTAGAVVDVLRGECFSAFLGGGARLDGRPIAVSACAELEAALVATGFSYRAELRERHGEIAHRVVSRARDLRCFGSAALELCWLACGRLDGYYERDIKVWDYSAAALVAEEAGGAVELPCPDNDDLVLAAAPGVFDALRRVVELPAG